MSGIKTAAEELIKIAEQLEATAEEKTVFACESCSHTASLKEINNKIKSYGVKVASEGGSFDVGASLVEVNDTIRCPSCGEGKMAYAPTAESEKFYITASEEEEEEDSSDIPKAKGEDGISDEDESKTSSEELGKEAGILDSLSKGIHNIKQVTSFPQKAKPALVDKADKAVDFLNHSKITERDLQTAANMLKKVKPQDYEFIYEAKDPDAESKMESFGARYGKELEGAMRALRASMNPQEHLEEHQAALSAPAKGIMAALLFMIGTAAAGEHRKVNMNDLLPGFDQATQLVEEMSSAPVEDLTGYDKLTPGADGKLTTVHVPGEGETQEQADQAASESAAKAEADKGWTEYAASSGSARVDQAKLAAYLG